MVMPPVSVEAARTQELLARIETLEEIADSLDAADPNRAKLLDVITQELGQVPPLRPVVAASVLELTEKTVRAWAAEGVLTISQHHPRLLLDADRVHEVWHLVRDLKQAGMTRGLLDEVYRRLVDQSLLDREDLQESLDQMRRGEGRVVRAKPRATRAG
jgi:hypothetical protein